MWSNVCYSRLGIDASIMLIILALAMCVSVTTTNIAPLSSCAAEMHQNIFNQFFGEHNISIINTRNYWSVRS